MCCQQRWVWRVEGITATKFQTFLLQRLPAAICSLSRPQQFLKQVRTFLPHPRELPPHRGCPLQYGNYAKLARNCNLISFLLSSLRPVLTFPVPLSSLSSHRRELFPPQMGCPFQSGNSARCKLFSCMPSTDVMHPIWGALLSPATRPCR